MALAQIVVPARRSHMLRIGVNPLRNGGCHVPDMTRTILERAFRAGLSLSGASTARTRNGLMEEVCMAYCSRVNLPAQEHWIIDCRMYGTTTTAR